MFNHSIRIQFQALEILIRKGLFVRIRCCHISFGGRSLELNASKGFHSVAKPFRRKVILDLDLTRRGGRMYLVFRTLNVYRLTRVPRSLCQTKARKIYIQLNATGVLPLRANKREYFSFRIYLVIRPKPFFRMIYSHKS